METLPHPHPNQLPATNPATPFVVQVGDGQSKEESFDFWGVLSRRKWLVFLGLVTGLGLGALWHVQSEEVYRSEAHIKIEPKNPIRMEYTRTQPMDPGGEMMNYRHDRFIGRDNIIRECLETYKLYNLRSFDELPQEQIAKVITKNLEVDPDRQEPFIYEMSYSSNNDEDCKTVLNSLIASYKSHLEQEYEDQSELFIKLLREVKQNFEGKYEVLNKQLLDLMDQNKSPVVSAGGLTVHQLNLGILSNRIKDAQDELNRVLNNQERVQVAIQSGPEAMDEMVWILLQQNQLHVDERQFLGANSVETKTVQRLNELQLQYQTLKATLGSGHPDMKQLKNQIDYWVSVMRENSSSDDIGVGYIALASDVLLSRYMMKADQQINDLKFKIEKDTFLEREHRQEAERLNLLSQRIEEVRRQRNQVEELLNTANKKIVEIDPKGDLNSSAGHDGFRFETLMPADIGDKTWPILPVILGISGLIGTLLGFGLGCLVEIADKTFHNPDEIMKQLNLPLIGHIPVISQSKRYLIENSLIEPVVCTYHRPKSQVSEAFRAVRTALYFNTQGKRNQVIQVTSPTPGDGKSTLAANLAVSIAQSGKRVLLVDADMRRPRQNVTFGITSSEGFATILSGQSNWREVIFECEEIEGLSVMPCGLKPNNPAELSSSPQVKELIEEMREEFDFVIIDTPPLLAVTDPCPIAARVDGVILTLRIKKNVRVSAERATDILRNVGASVVGLVVNGVGAQTGYGSQYTYGAYRAGYAYNGYGYGYGYGYGQGGKYYDEEASKRTNPAARNIEAQPTEIE